MRMTSKFPPEVSMKPTGKKAKKKHESNLARPSRWAPGALPLLFPGENPITPFSNDRRFPPTLSS